MDKAKIAKQLVGIARELVAGEGNLTLEDIQEKASKVIEHLVRAYGLDNADDNMGSRDSMTVEEEYEEGYVCYTLWDKTWEKEHNDLLSIEMCFKKDGTIDVKGYLFGTGKEIYQGGDNLNESQVYAEVDKMLKDWRMGFKSN